MCKKLCKTFDIEHLERLVIWAIDNESHNNPLFLVESLAPLIFGKKPSVLLNVSYNDEMEWNEFERLITLGKALGVKKIRKINRRLQVIFYQSHLLDAVLRQKPIQEFLQSLSYPKGYSLDIYLNVLIEKILSPKFPHEVGVFLGYPLKDVLGFMGLLPLPYIRTQGWRIYGDETPSNEVYKTYINARSMMRGLVGNIDYEKNLTPLLGESEC